MAMQSFNYETAVKKAQLVERNPEPNGVALVDPKRVSKHDQMDIIALATQIQEADKRVQIGTCQKLSLILDQIKMLQKQAFEIMQESEESRTLHNAACNFEKKPGQIYYLYQRASGQHYFSMLSPEEWNGSVDQKYMGAYRLEYDLSWTPVEKTKEKDEKIKWAQKLMNAAQNNTPMSIDFVPAIEDSK